MPYTGSTSQDSVSAYASALPDRETVAAEAAAHARFCAPNVHIESLILCRSFTNCSCFHMRADYMFNLIIHINIT
nr:MAG TPA: hypothetical protein [Caudoviricetes sp.]DAT93769.1 MAG TPA: hypothetical protein [Caudoviricetes sp.]